jgi:hypothetical protein
LIELLNARAAEAKAEGVSQERGEARQRVADKLADANEAGETRNP